MNPRVLVVVFVVLIVLFVGSLNLRAVGITDGAPSLTPNLNAPWVQSVRARLTRSLSGKDLRVAAGSAVGCQVSGEQLQISALGTCRFSVVPADSTRRLSLTLTTGLSATLTLAQEGALTIENEPLAAGDKAKSFDIYQNKQSATLTLFACQVAKDDQRKRCAVSLK